MIAYHVTSQKKFLKYVRSGFIEPPVRAWSNISSAESFSKQTGRRVILRLRVTDFEALEGHKGQAIIVNERVSVEGF